MKRLLFLTISAATALGACGDLEGLEESTETQTLPIRAEVPGAVDVVGRKYLVDPDVTLSSYAAVRISNGASVCSGTMIGPNVVMTAGHCGGADRPNSSVQFRVYRSTTPSLAAQTETFTCKFLVQDFPGHDMALHHCAPNWEGENPGDKYGYIGIDGSQPTTRHPLYSVWWNPITGVPDASLLSTGLVLSAQTQSPGIVQTNLWSNPGASGSSYISARSHKILVGPTSTGSGDTRGRNGHAMREYLRAGRVGGTSFDLSVANLQALGLDPGRFRGALDGDGDGVFDVQEAIEAAPRGHRDMMWLGFDDARANAQWRGHSTTYDLDRESARIRASSSGVPMRRQDLDLRPNTRYRVRLATRTYSSAYAANLELRIVDRGNYTTYAGHTLRTTAGAGWEGQAFLLTTGAHPAELQVRNFGPIDAELASLVIVEDSAVMDFDTHDKRWKWTNPNNGQRAFVLPEGRSARGPNWAGLVQKDSSRPYGTDWSLATRHMALAPGRSLQVCFDVRQRTGASSVSHWGRMRAGTDGVGVAGTVQFPLGNQWAQVCTGGFTLSGHNNFVEFGTEGGAALPGASYLVDNLRVIGDSGPHTYAWAGQVVDHPQITAWLALPGVRAIPGDYDGDGLTDIALTGGSGWGSVPVAFSRGDGRFEITNQSVANVPSWASRSDVTIQSGDFDGDGADDLVLFGGAWWRSIPVAFSDRAGGFRVVNIDSPAGSFASASSTIAVVAGQFGSPNGTDRCADLAMIHPGGVELAYGRCDGRFTRAAIADPTVPAWARAAKVQVGDFDGDGMSDLAFPGAWGGVPIAFLRGRQLHKTAHAVQYAGTWAAMPTVTTLVDDFDGDGDDDLAFTGGSGWRTLPVAYSLRNGSFSVYNQAVSYEFAVAANRAQHVLVGQFDGSGRADVLTLGGNGDTAFTALRR